MTLCNDPASGSILNLNDGISYLMTQGMGLGNEGIHGLISGVWMRGRFYFSCFIGGIVVVSFLFDFC